MAHIDEYRPWARERGTKAPDLVSYLLRQLSEAYELGG